MLNMGSEVSLSADRTRPVGFVGSEPYQKALETLIILVTYAFMLPTLSIHPQ